MARSHVVRRGPERLRVGTWRAGSSVGYLAPVGEVPPPTAAMVHHCCDLLAARGLGEVLTGALAPAEQRGFVDAGFVVREELHLLVHDLRDLPPHRPAPLRRARVPDRPRVLEVDGAAFPPFWRLDVDGLADALAATPISRFRVAMAGGLEALGHRGQLGEHRGEPLGDHPPTLRPRVASHGPAGARR